MSIFKVKNILNNYGYEFIHLKSTSTTMDDAKKYIKQNNRNCVVLADQQYEGKGSRGKKWASPKGNVYCSLSFDNFLNIKDHFIFSAITAISVKMALENFDAKNIKFKWPNDIYCNNKKFAGIILDTYSLKNYKHYMIIGLGINVVSSPILSEYPTTYLKEFSKVKNVPEFLIFFYKIFFENFNKIHNSQKNLFIDMYKKSLMFVGEKIQIKLNDNSIVNGTFKGINNDGSLQLQNEHGLTSVYSGTIQI